MDHLINAGKYQEALQIITNKLDEDPLNQEYYNKKLTILEMLGYYDEVISMVNPDDLDTINDISLPMKIQRLQLLATSYDQKGQYRQAIDILDQIKTEIDSISSTHPEYNSMLQKYYTTYGMVKINQGKLDEAYELYRQAMDIDSDTIETHQRASLYNNMGIIYWHWGRIDDAIENYHRSLEFYKQIGDKKGISRLSNNIGIIYYDKGQLMEALTFYQNSLEVDIEIGSQRSAGLTMSNIGELYRHLRDFDQSFYYLNQSMKILDLLGDQILRAVTLNQLILTSIEVNEIDKSRHYFEQLRQIDSESDNVYIHQFTMYSEALILKQSNRAKQVIKAHDIFQEIVNEEVIISEITAQSLFNLCELLINEVKSYGATEVIKEIRQNVLRLQDIAQNQKSTMLEVQAYLIDSKIDLLEQEYAKALEKIYQAKQLADRYDLTKLGYQITREYDAMIEQIKVWKKHPTKHVDLRFEELKLDELFSKLSTERYKDELIQSEEPIALFILDRDGKLRFSKEFSDKLEVNGNLISSFLAAINIFSQDLFQTNYSIDRIKHGDYVIMLKSYGTFAICYIFNGDSYLAEKRIEKFAESLTDHRIIHEIILVSDLNPTPMDMGDLLQVIDELFTDLN